MLYRKVANDNNRNVTVLVNDGLLNANEEHPNIDAIWDALTVFEDSGEVDVDELVNLFDKSHRAGAVLVPLSERISVANSRIYVDGDEVVGPYADQAVAFLDDGAVEDYQPLVYFLEKVYTNIEAHTRENLARWLDSTGGFTIDEDGDIIGYKGLTEDGKSIRQGPGIVNGVPQNGHLDNAVGNVVEMQRSAVQHDPSVGCSVGLHVGTWEYAKGFGHGVVAKVKVNPRDVVSVPTDCNGQKMRVCRYTVLEYVDSATKGVVEPPSDLVPSEDYIDGYVDGYDDAEEGVGPKF